MTDMEIETFLTVLRCGSMTAAAQALYITQPTLSARLQTLEDEVGTPLFVRGKGLRRLELTDAGSRFLPLAQRWRKLTDEMRGIAAAEARTHFRIGAVYTANQYVLPPVYKRFLERDLPVALRVETLSSQQAQEAVTRRELDMAIVEDDVGFNPELQVTPLFRESFYMICSEGSDYPELVDPRDLDMSQEINVSQRREVQVWNDYWFGPAARPLLNTDTVQLAEAWPPTRRVWAAAPSIAAEHMRRAGRAKICRFTAPPPDRISYLIAPGRCSCRRRPPCFWRICGGSCSSTRTWSSIFDAAGKFRKNGSQGRKSVV